MKSFRNGMPQGTVETEKLRGSTWLWPIGFYGVIIFFDSETLYNFGCETLRGS